MSEEKDHHFLRRVKSTSLHIALYRDGKKNGFGMVDYFAPRLQLSIGYFVNNKLNGLGSQVVGEGSAASRYLGSFRHNFPHGFGILATQNMVYRGYFENGDPQGFGIIIDKEGCRRIGSFKKRSMNGYGEIINPSKQYRFSGLLMDNVQHGGGEESLGKETFLGFFAFGKRHGIGHMKRKELEYIGSWKDGSRTGYGSEKVEGLYDYFGSFVNGHKEGICEISYPDKTVYIGQIKGNRKTGFGKQSLGKEVYIGYWRNDRRHGLGYYKDQKGQTFFGQWREDCYISQRGLVLHTLDESQIRTHYKQPSHDASQITPNTLSEISYMVDDDEATPEFFSTAASRIIEIDQKLTGARIRMKEQYTSLQSLKFKVDKRLLDTAATEIELLSQNAQKEFDYMLEVFSISSQKHGFDIFEAKQKLAAFPADRATRRISEDPYNTPALKPVSRTSRPEEVPGVKVLDDLVKDIGNENYFTLDNREKSEVAIFEHLLKDRKDSSQSKSAKQSGENSLRNTKPRVDESFADPFTKFLPEIEDKHQPADHKEIAAHSENLLREDHFSEAQKTYPASNVLQPSYSQNILSNISDSVKPNKEFYQSPPATPQKGADQTVKQSQASLQGKSFDELAAKKKEVEARLAAIEASLTKLNAY